MLESYKELIAAKSEIKQLKKQLEEAKPVHAQWWEIYDSNDEFVEELCCSNCGHIRKDTFNFESLLYCPHCGARMDGEKN